MGEELKGIIDSTKSLEPTELTEKKHREKKVERVFKSVDGDFAEPIEHILGKFYTGEIPREEAKSSIVGLVGRKIETYLDTLETLKKK